MRARGNHLPRARSQSRRGGFVATAAAVAILASGCGSVPEISGDAPRAAEQSKSPVTPKEAPKELAKDGKSPGTRERMDNSRGASDGESKGDRTKKKRETDGVTRAAEPKPPTAAPEPQPKAAASDPAGWATLWRDDFNSLNTKRWNVRERGEAPNQEALFLKRNVSVSDGLLRVQAKKETVSRWKYTAGYLDTNGKVALPDYFRLEIRAKVPWGKGLWPAPMWLRPADYSSGEIDVVETFGRAMPDPASHHTIHTSYGAGHEQVALVKKFRDLGSSAWDWHTYRVEKTPGKIKMWVDGELAASYSSGEPSWFDRYYEAGKKWNLRVNFNVGGEWNGMPDSSTPWEDNPTMKVDYIQAWSRK